MVFSSPDIFIVCVSSGFVWVIFFEFEFYVLWILLLLKHWLSLTTYYSTCNQFFTFTRWKQNSNSDKRLVIRWIIILQKISYCYSLQPFSLWNFFFQNKKVWNKKIFVSAQLCISSSLFWFFCLAKKYFIFLNNSLSEKLFERFCSNVLTRSEVKEFECH